MSYEAWGDDDGGPEGYVTDERAAEMVKEATAEMEQDILVLMLRLYGEDGATFAPETLEVFNRWKPKIDAKLGGSVDRNTASK
jgi:hypothetical protein